MTVVAVDFRQARDARPLLLHVEPDRRAWRGRLLIGSRRVLDVRDVSRASVLADLLDALLANGVDVDPCCVDE